MVRIGKGGRRWSTIVAVCAALGMGACSTAPQNNNTGGNTLGDTTGGSDIQLFGDATKTDAVTGDGGKTDGTSTGGAVVTLTFDVDDSANQTFGDGEIVWTGSFAWDDKTNTIVYATSWLPTDGPYPPLYDDGPISAGGHEREGAVKGDHIFTTQVKFATSADVTLEYGALNELGNWMWVGPNGKLALKKGQSGVVAVPGMKLPKHGSLDMKVTLDTAKLNACCTTWSGKDYALYLKGTMNMWTPIQLLDDGQKGDEKAADGIVTYVHKLNLGTHDGGLNAGEEVQFIFVATKGDQTPDAGQEYKNSTKAILDGVAAWTNTGEGGAWESVPVVLSKDSKGKVDNTAIVVPTPKGGTGACTPPCNDNQTCEAGVCKDKAPTTCNPECKLWEQCVSGACEPAPVTVTAVDPSKGDTAGGAVVTVTGTHFAPTATVQFGGADATDIMVEFGGTTLTCKTPPHAAGLVDVVVKNANGQSGTLTDAFSYQAPAAPSATLVPLGSTNLVAAGQQWDLSALVAIGTVTAAPGVTPDLAVMLGTGATGTDPDKDGGQWTWTAAQYGGEGKAGDEQWSAPMPALAKGNWLAAAKVVYKTTTVFSATLAVSAVDPADLPASLTGLNPTFASVLGGSTILIQGSNLAAGSTVEFVPKTGAAAAAVSVAAVAGGLQVQVPALPLGLATVAVTPPGKSALVLTDALTVAPIATPKLAGDPAKSFDNALKVGTNSLATDWGAGKNELTTLWVAYDAVNLYVGIAGQCESTNAIVAYLDVDYGSSTGVKAPSALSDNSGAVDDAVSNALTVADTAIGLDFAFASLGMQSFSDPDLGKSTGAGWRSLANAADLGWLAGEVKATAGVGLEAAMPLKTLYPNGIPAGGAVLRIQVALGNGNGGFFSNAYLPEHKGSTAGQLGEFASVPVYVVQP
ncbi:MAG: IPT/TIG domain-containing protein [Deltaproteobacteria bacterium]|nr:IPT/TIG domain-containing protein [Deltaproteobacteria bacterium]